MGRTEDDLRSQPRTVYLLRVPSALKRSRSHRLSGVLLNFRVASPETRDQFCSTTVTLFPTTFLTMAMCPLVFSASVLNTTTSSGCGGTSPAAGSFVAELAFAG